MTEEKDLFNFNDEDKVEGGNFHDFKEKPEVTGILKDVMAGRFGDTYLIETPEKEDVTVGGYTAIKGKLTKEDIGKAVKIKFVGERKGNSGRLYMDFEVFKKAVA